MKEIFLNRRFVKQYKKLPRKVQQKFCERVDLFQENPKSRLLNLHTVMCQGSIFISMNITGDYRALFIQEGEHAVRFYRIGTHSQLYG